MPIWQLCANLLIPNCLRSNLSYSPLAALELYVNIYIIKGLHTLGLEAVIITVAAVIGSTLCAWGLWYLLYSKGKETKA